MKHENILKAITTAIAHLENSIKALAKEDEKKVTRFVWRASSDLEYALFLCSLIHQDETESSSWKLDPHSKQAEIGPSLISAQNLLKEAKDSLEAEEDLHEAYKKTWMAQGHLLRIQGFFEKWRKGEKTVSS